MCTANLFRHQNCSIGKDDEEKAKVWALPTLNMPKKSHYSIVRDQEDNKTNKRIYKNFEELCVRVKSSENSFHLEIRTTKR